MKFLVLIYLSLSSLTHAWEVDLKKEIEKMDQDFPGEIGVVIKNLRDGTIMRYNDHKKWYLSSTIKVMVGISLLQKVEQGTLNLNQKVTLKEKDFVDGGGVLIWSEPGKQFTVSEILKAMLRESDNTAADILIDLIGIKELNLNVTKWMPGAGKITSLLKVRYLAYGELHPKVQSLSNMDFILLKNHPLEKRHEIFAEKINVPLKELKARGLEEAFEKYYQHGHNSAFLADFVSLLEKLEKGKLLTKVNTNLLMQHMESMKTGDHRIKAGLSPELKFFQKTGTQIHRACNVGLIKKSNDKADLALAVCIRKPSENMDSDIIFKKLGQKISNLVINQFQTQTFLLIDR